jgi:hypothetical protein
VKPKRQVYLIKVWRDTDNRLRLQLRAANEEQPVYFASLSELAAFFETHNPPRTPQPSGLK